MLHHPNWDSKFIVQTDASAKGLGAVLTQIDNAGKERPVRYASRALQPLEAKWTTREQELMAVVWVCETFHRYLWGKKFIIQTDHANLQWLQSISPQKPRLSRWALRLTEYEFDLQHRPGKSNTNADALSRNPHPTPEVPPLMDISTCAVLCSLAGIDTKYRVY